MPSPSLIVRPFKVTKDNFESKLQMLMFGIYGSLCLSNDAIEPLLFDVVTSEKIMRDLFIPEKHHFNFTKYYKTAVVASYTDYIKILDNGVKLTFKLDENHGSLIIFRLTNYLDKDVCRELVIEVDY